MMKLNKFLGVGVFCLGTLLATGAHAATYTVSAAQPVDVESSFTGTPLGVDVDKLLVATSSMVDFLHMVVTPQGTPGHPGADQTMSYSLTLDGSPATPAIEFVLHQIGDHFTTGLSAGTWSMKVVNLDTTQFPTANAGTTRVSVVPLPGAALLFGSGLLGFLGFANRRKV
jgi:hypothetical protein